MIKCMNGNGEGVAGEGRVGGKKVKCDADGGADQKSSRADFSCKTGWVKGKTSNEACDATPK